MEWLAIYLMFVVAVLVAVAYLVIKLKLPSPTIIAMIVGILIISPVLVSYLYSIYIAPLPEVVVPELTWLTLEEAEVRLSKEGLKYRIAERVYERTVPDGRVVSQRPEPGRVVKKGRVINLIVSIGKRKVAVPNLVGRPFSQIEVVLSVSGLKVGEKEEEYNEQYQTGVVAKQYPLPDTLVDIGTRVDVVIAENPKFGIVKVPKLVGIPLVDAQEVLNELKLNGIVFYHETDLFEEGVIVSQTPIEGTELEMGSRVNIFVAVPPGSEEIELEEESEHE